MMVNVFNDLFERSFHDPGIESFLVNVFLKNYSELKHYKLVCKRWKQFIDDNLWRNNRIRNSFLNILKNNLISSSQEGEYELKLDLNIVKGVNDLFDLKCNDNIVVLDVSNLDSAELLLVNLHNHNKKLLKLGGFDVTGGERIVYEVGRTNCFYTAFSHRPKVLVWSERGLLVSEFPSLISYIRRICASGELLYILGRKTIVVLKHTEADNISMLYLVTMDPSSGTARCCVQYPGKPEDWFVSGHDRFLCVWNLGTDGLEARKIPTGLVKDLVVKNDIAIIVGSSQNPGINFWDLNTCTHLKTISRKGIYCELQLSGDHILVRGNFVIRGFLDLSQLSVIRNNDVREKLEHIGITATKVVTFDIARDVLIVRDFWNTC